MDGLRTPFDAVEGSAGTADVACHFMGNRSRVEQGELSGSHGSQARAGGVARQHVVPFGRAPLPPLALGQPHGDWAGLKHGKPSSPLDDTPVAEIPDGGTKVGRREVSSSGGDLAELAISSAAGRKPCLDQAEHGQQRRRLA